MFYSPRKLLSYNALFNFVIGERGVGKTYGSLKFVIKRFLLNKEQFIYLRRFKTELPRDEGELFGKISNEFPGVTFEIEKGRDRQIIKINDEVAGWCIPLSTSLVLKSNNTFSDVKTIIFDEFIIGKGVYHYLQNEVTQFLEFYETIARLRDVRVLFLANAISITNPYFNYFHLEIPYNSEYRLYMNGNICVNYVKNLAYREAKSQTRFGQIVAGSKYGKYAVNNDFLQDNKTFIKRRSEKSKFYFILKVSDRKFGIWSDRETGEVYFSEKIDPNCPITFTTSVSSHSENVKLLQVRNSVFMKTILEKYRDGLVCFENQICKNYVEPVLQKYVN